MIIYQDFDSVEKVNNSVLTIGTFDGVHLGHVEILKTLVKKARLNNRRSVVVTFNPHPRAILYQDLKKIELLTPFDKKIELIESFGIDVLIIVNFTQTFSQISYDYFLEKIVIEKIGLSEIILGYDHRFGKNRDGNSSILLSLKNRLGFEVTTLPPIQKNNITISSTKIREFLREGKIQEANSLLGRNYSLRGIVVHGDKRGRTLGFPTANIEFFDNKNIGESMTMLIPPYGVYYVEIGIRGKKYMGVMNIGFRPSFSKKIEEKGSNQITEEADRNVCPTHESAVNRQSQSIDSQQVRTENPGYAINEVHILDFNEMIYDENIEVLFIERIRDERKFNTIEELKKQINKDIAFVKKGLTN